VARVLVVEDETENLYLMTYLLNASGHDVLVARDGVEGVRAAAAERPDLVVMKIDMPKMDGYEAVAALKADPELASIPVVAVTGYAMVGDRERVVAAGFDGYLSKPIDPRRFADQLTSHLDHESANGDGRSDR
jgi:CheY-like chemotaxis protein